ncbi:MAG TPA: hypothetical protein VKF80_01020 [Candidatus Eisenbacteria bacterium]|nr:hypothetical protein [Candidatus Eisenbacteria bacterium]
MTVRAGLLAVALFACATSARASEGPFVWRTVSLLGGNEREHMYVVSKHGDTAGYLADSVFVYERSNSDPRWTQRTLIRATIRHAPSDTTRDTEAFVAAFDLPAFLTDHDCHPPFFVEWPESVAVDTKGMYCHERGARSYFMTRDELLGWLDYDVANLDSKGADLRVVDLCRTTASEEEGALTDFLIVRAGGASAAGKYEAIVPVADTQLQAASQDVRQKLAARKKTTAKKR